VEFETLCHQAWLKGIEQQKAGLQAPLLVRHPETGQLLVNLEKDVMQLIRYVIYQLASDGFHLLLCSLPLLRSLSLKSISV
jgi:dynein heavy chain